MEVVVAVAAGAENKVGVPLKQLLADVWKTLLASLGAFLRWSPTSALHFPSPGKSCLMPVSISDNEVKITAVQHHSGLILPLKTDLEETGKKVFADKSLWKCVCTIHTSVFLPCVSLVYICTLWNLPSVRTVQTAINSITFNPEEKKRECE